MPRVQERIDCHLAGGEHFALNQGWRPANYLALLDFFYWADGFRQGTGVYIVVWWGGEMQGRWKG